eukprot:TRINITY_DN32800_c0_g1_i1.p1 TRINITY_DN32800_c0_g1~~TRINITY_DN32800_c0_g1_i1.p1  ORF type:complete len:172 (+),score=35.76 TRINITY_DN32800_c0_g1_i1:83-598(+)
MCCFFFFFFQAEDGIRDVERSRGLGDVYKRQLIQLLFLEAKFLSFIEEICFRSSQIHNFRASISVFFHHYAFLAVVCVGYSRPTADSAAALHTAEVAFIADFHEGTGAYVGVADHTFPIALLAEPSYSYPMYSALIPVSYTHLTLPTILLVQISVVAGSLKKKKKQTNTFS